MGMGITGSGRASARLLPAAPARWLMWDEVEEIFNGPGESWHLDGDLVDQEVRAPWLER